VLAVAAACFVIGAGFGLASAPTIVAVQSVVDWQRRGVVTGTNLFCRNLGSAVGVAVFGAIANASLADHFADPPADVAGRLPESSGAEQLLLGGHAAGAVKSFVQSALFDASHDVFVGVVVTAVALFAVLWLMPRRTEMLDVS
jgi:hypothetical protein